MLALSQATTESLLSQAIEAAGGEIERGTKLVACHNVDDGVEAVIESSGGMHTEVDHYQWLLAADGSHSLVREQLGIDFSGPYLDNEWYLADAPLHTTFAQDRAHVFLKDDGEFLFLVRVVDDIRNDSAHVPLWRAFGNRPDPLSRLVGAEPVGSPVWTSSFEISHQVASKFSVGHVYLAGDAAHIHSPAGARGMNLGIEDAWCLAKLAGAQRLSDYHRLRQPVDRRVVREVELLSNVIAAESFAYRLVRSCMFPAVTWIPFLRSRMIAMLTGLDHPLPELPSAVRINEPYEAVSNHR
jgi:2-polyprenyl-6-methoxyphenol hydroxylase-like FAD-dependent oxidoreductase